MGHSMLAISTCTQQSEGKVQKTFMMSLFSSERQQQLFITKEANLHFLPYSLYVFLSVQLFETQCTGIGTMWSVAARLHHFFNLYFLCHTSSDNHMLTFASDMCFGVLLYWPEGTKGKVTVGRKGQSTIFCTIHVTSFHCLCMSCGVCDAGYCEYDNFRFFVCFSSSFSHL